MNNSVGTLKFYPSNGKIVDGSYAEYKGNTYRVIRVRENGLRAEIDVHGTIQFVNVDELKLMKFYCIGKKSNVIGELSYYDYDKAREGDLVKGHVMEKQSHIYEGEQVYITCFNTKINTEGTVLSGRVLSVDRGIFTVEVGNQTAKLRRYTIRPKDKPNSRNLFYIETVIKRKDDK